MKKIVLLLCVCAMFTSLQAQRIYTLTEETSPTGGTYVLIDKSTYATPRKVTINNLVKATRQYIWHRMDTIEKYAGLDTNGTYPTPAGYYINLAEFTAESMDANIYNATMILDSHLYRVEEAVNLWEAGAGTRAIKMRNEAGRANYANGTNSLAIGDTTVAEGDYSFSIGQYNTARGKSSITAGKGSITPPIYYNSFAIAMDTTALGKKGASQYMFFNTFVETVGATPEDFFLDPNDLLNELVIGIDMVVNFELHIVAVQTGGSSGTVGDSFTQRINGGIANKAGTTALVGSVNAESAIKDVAFGGTVAVTADDVNEALKVTVTGESNKNITWSMTVEITMVGFRNFNLE